MVNKKYKVIRSKVYYGEVIVPKILGTSRNNERSIFEYRPLRHMIFELTDDGNAVDLLNKVPEYKVFEEREDIDCGEYTIYHSICLSDILSYLGYLEELGYKDIKNIRDEIFSGHFASDNPEIFGLVEEEYNGRTRFKKLKDSLVEQYFLRRFDDLRKRTIMECINDSTQRMDPFKITIEEKKKRLVI